MRQSLNSYAYVPERCKSKITFFRYQLSALPGLAVFSSSSSRLAVSWFSPTVDLSVWFPQVDLLSTGITLLRWSKSLFARLPNNYCASCQTWWPCGGLYIGSRGFAIFWLTLGWCPMASTHLENSPATRTDGLPNSHSRSQNQIVESSTWIEAKVKSRLEEAKVLLLKSGLIRISYTEWIKILREFCKTTEF